MVRTKGEVLRKIYAAFLTVAALFVMGCSVGDDNTPDYRYRLTVEVETPQGVHSGSSVIEVEQTMGRSAGSGFGAIIMRRVRGEAVAVELPNGSTVFALLRSDDDVDWASHVVANMAPELGGEAWEESFDNVLLLEAESELPRQWPAVGGLEDRSAYPMLVTFADLDDPTSVERVNPDDLAATFGEGFHLKRITVQLTNDPVTTGIDERLAWLNDPAVMENPGWKSMALEVRKLLLGLRTSKLGSER